MKIIPVLILMETASTQIYFEVFVDYHSCCSRRKITASHLDIVASETRPDSERRSRETTAGEKSTVAAQI